MATAAGPLKFAYEYEGRLAAGMPHTSGQASGTGIKCRLDVHIDESARKAVIKVKQLICLEKYYIIAYKIECFFSTM